MFLRDMKTSRFFLLAFLFFLPFLGISQNKNQLEKEKLDNIRKIKETEKIIQETKSKKQATIGQLAALSQQINARNSLIESIGKEVELLDKEIFELEDLIQSMEMDLVLLKEEYAKMIYSASKLNSQYDKLTFLFAAESFNQLIMRIRFFKQYSQARQHQVEQIEKVKASLSSQKKELAEKRRVKNTLISNKTTETNKLNQVKDEKSVIVKELSNKEKELLKELEISKKSIKKLDRLIENLVKKEMEKMRLKAELERKELERKELEKKKLNASHATHATEHTNVSTTNNLKLTPEAEMLSNSFAGNASRLPWPVLHGTISQKFGRQPHPVLDHVEIDNLGINILTLKSEPVRTVFKGKIVTVAEVPGMNKVVMIQHGEYFTVYAKLKNVAVVTGQEVNAKDVIGEVYTDKNDVSEIQFQIWKNSVKLDPEKWLYVK
jgi:septal ring factor EnvC (AmiA/AmiB activator)